MLDVSLMDCTLRDGGYLNDWKFGRVHMERIFNGIAKAGIDMVEIGFLDERRVFDPERSILPDTESFGKVFGEFAHRNTLVFAMIDYGTCALEHIAPCKDTILDGIRVIFKKHNRKAALQFCAELKKLGYLVCAQLVSVASYSDEELIDLASLANKVLPYAVSMVDTYSVLYPEDVEHIQKILDRELDPEIRLGFHAHNNLQMAYANTVAFLKLPSRHKVFVDGTLFGMGKNTGNAPVELLASYLNENHEKQYATAPLLEVVKQSMMPLRSQCPWGYSLNPLMSSLHHCHPKYIAYYDAKEDLTMEELEEILTWLEEGEEPLYFDEALADSLYQRKKHEN